MRKLLLALCCLFFIAFATGIANDQVTIRMANPDEPAAKKDWRVTPWWTINRTGFSQGFAKTIRGHESLSWPAYQSQHKSALRNIDVEQLGVANPAKCTVDIRGTPGQWKIEIATRSGGTKCTIVPD